MVAVAARCDKVDAHPAKQSGKDKEDAKDKDKKIREKDKTERRRPISKIRTRAANTEPSGNEWEEVAGVKTFGAYEFRTRADEIHTRAYPRVPGELL